MLGTLLASLASVETAQVVIRLKRAAVHYTLAAVAGLLGLGFLLGAAFIAISRHYTTLQTSIGFGIAFLAVALVVILYHRISTRAEIRRQTQKRSVEMKTIAGAAAVTLVPLLLQRGGLKALLLPAAAIAGLAIFRENARRGPRDDLD